MINLPSKRKTTFSIIKTRQIFEYKNLKDKMSKSKENIKEEITKKFNSHDNQTLNKNLKHLEFLNYLEYHFNEKELNQFPIDFLQSFQKIKAQAQKNTINSLHFKVA